MADPFAEELRGFAHPRAAELDDYWAERLGIPRNWAEASGVHVVATDDVRVERVGLFRRGPASVVRVNPRSIDTLDLRGDGCDDVESLRRRLEATHIELVHYVDPPEFVRPAMTTSVVRRLTADDAGLFEQFHDECDPEEVQHTDVKFVHPGLYAAFAVDCRVERHPVSSKTPGVCRPAEFVGESIVAAASLIHHGPKVTDVGVLVHPDHRRRGHGRRVVAASTECDEVGGRVVQYCTRSTNAGSRGVARSLGFRLYGLEEWFRLPDAAE